MLNILILMVLEGTTENTPNQKAPPDYSHIHQSLQPYGSGHRYFPISPS